MEKKNIVFDIGDDVRVSDNYGDIIKGVITEIDESVTASYFVCLEDGHGGWFSYDELEFA